MRVLKVEYHRDPFKPVKTIHAQSLDAVLYVPRIGENVRWSDNIGDCGKVYNVELHVHTNLAKVFVS